MNIEKVTEFILKTEKVSISALQREFRICYNRAKMIVDLLEKEGLNESNSVFGFRKVRLQKAMDKLKEEQVLLDLKFNED